MRYGYARCSTNENRQDIQRQLRELKAAGADAVIWEYEHGDAVHKAELDALLQERAKAGDTIIATEISRLSRSTKQLCEIIDRVKEKRLRLVILGRILSLLGVTYTPLRTPKKLAPPHSSIYLCSFESRKSTPNPCSWAGSVARKEEA